MGRHEDHLGRLVAPFRVDETQSHRRNRFSLLRFLGPAYGRVLDLDRGRDAPDREEHSIKECVSLFYLAMDGFRS